MSHTQELSEIRHQIRNHVNNITMNAELAKMQLESQGSAENIAKCVERILQQCQNCGDYLNSLSES